MNSAIDHERAEELAALCAVGAATPEELHELNTLRVQSGDMASLARAYDEVAAALALELPPVAPPPGALGAIRGRIAAAPAAGGDGSVTSLAERRARAPRRRWPQVMAGLAAAAAVTLGVLWTRERQTASELRERVAEAETATGALQDTLATERRRLAALQLELASAEHRMEHIQSPSLQLATLRAGEQPSTPKAKIFIDPDNRRWLVLAYDLPPIDPSRQDYQLWFIPSAEGAAPMPAGLLAPSEEGVYEADVRLPADVDVAHAAISLEKKGGVEVPTDVKMLGPLL